MDLEFLKSNRFWAMILGAVILYLSSKGFLGKEELILIETIIAGFVGVRTVDRLGEKIGGGDNENN